MKNKIVIYSNSPIVGGHEKMGVEIIKTLLQQYDIEAIISSRNHALKEMLETLNIPIYSLDYQANRFQSIRNWFSFKHLKKISIILSEVRPKMLVLLQGNIELSLIAAFTAKKMGIKTISYIPLTQSLHRTSKNKIFGYFRELLRRKLYTIPDEYITISKAQKENIQKYVNYKKIYLIRNFVDTNSLRKMDKAECRKELNLPLDKFIIGYIGRFEAWHKGLDKICDFLEAKAKTFPDIIFLFVGSGSYEKRIRNLSAKFQNIKMVGWMNNLSKVYSAIDGLIMPSRYEGVSLTMLEAQYFGIPIIGNNIPELAEYNNLQNLFSLDNNNSIEEKIYMIKRSASSSNVVPSVEVQSLDLFKTEVLKVFSKIIV